MENNLTENTVETVCETKEAKFVFETQFNSEVADKINKQAMKKTLWINIVLSIVLCLEGIVLLPDNGGLGVVLILFGLLVYPGALILTKISQKGINKTMSVMSDSTNETFSFFEDKCVIETVKGCEYRGFTEATYSYFYKVIEDDENYFFYISKMQMHVIPKYSMTKGDLEDFNRFLWTVMRGKFSPSKSSLKNL